MVSMDRVNDFAFKIATANGTGSASANGLIMLVMSPDALNAGTAAPSWIRTV